MVPFQLAGPGGFGPPKDRDAAVEIAGMWFTSRAIASRNGRHVTNQLIGEVLHPYPDDLVIVAKIGARPGPDGSWIPALSREEFTRAHALFRYPAG
jgi:pyridoxine 4-dehydrogenase